MKQSALLAIIRHLYSNEHVERSYGPAARASNPDLAVKGADIYCTGYISETPPRSELQV